MRKYEIQALNEGTEEHDVAVSDEGLLLAENGSF